MKRSWVFNIKGMSINELLVSMMIFSILIAVIVGIYLTSLRTYRLAVSESELFAEGSNAIEVIQRGPSGINGLMKARSGTLLLTGTDRIDFSIDRNLVYTQSTADDETLAVYFDDGDGSSSTLKDNTVAFEYGDGTVVNVGKNVASVNFAVTGNVITVTLAMADVVGNHTSRVLLTRDILMRN